jgi:hypothetical protein
LKVGNISTLPSTSTHQQLALDYVTKQSLTLKVMNFFFQKLFLFGLALVASATAQIYTVAGPDGYKYPKPQGRFNLETLPVKPDPVVEEIEKQAVSLFNNKISIENANEIVDFIIHY